MRSVSFDALPFSPHMLRLLFCPSFFQVLETNVVGPMLVTQTFLPLIPRDSGSKLVFISSRCVHMAVILSHLFCTWLRVQAYT